ncbi:long-chain-fatty-acid--CoA ligase [Gordonia sp. NPDC003376]
MWRHRSIRVLPDIARHWSRMRPDKVALIDTTASVSYRELEDRTNQIAHAAIDAGVRRGDRIGYVGPNSVSFWECWLGTNKAGGIFVPLNWRFATPEFVALIDDAALSVVVVDPQFVTILREVRDLCIRPFEIVVFGTELDGEIGIDQWIADQPTTDPSVPISSDDVSLLAYTSGTTGHPKGAQVTHRAFDNWFMMASLEPTETFHGDDVVLMIMPNFHLAGSWLTLSGIYHGATIAVVGQFDPGTFFTAVTEFRPTVVCLVPTAIQMIVHHPDAAHTDFGSIRRILYAGSAISADTIRAATDRIGCELEQFYGTTETYIITILRPEAHDPDNAELLASCGSPFPFVEVRVADADGHDVADDTVGEVLVRSPIMIDGYWNNPEATASAFSGEWYKTGDLGRLDGDGNLYLVDRAKDMIVTGGENVYSVEVERALNLHPAVRSAAVLGLPSDRWGEQVTAFVVTDSEVTEAQLIAHCRDHIAGYKVPKSITFLDQLPTTPSGKVRKNVLRASVSPSLDPSSR